MISARTRYRLRNLPTRIRGWKAELCTLLGIGCLAELRLTVLHGCEWDDEGTLLRYASSTPLGVVSRRQVTNNGVAFIVDAFQNLVELEAMNFHDVGTGTNAEAAANSALQTPYGGSRATGTQTEPASNQYTTTGLVSFSGSFAITEHGVFSASSSGVLLDRSVFTAVNVVSGDAISAAYTLSLTAGG